MHHETNTTSRPGGTPAPALSHADLGRARFELMMLPGLVGDLPLPVYVWLEEILARQDDTAAWLAAEITAVVHP